jgi:hypothetical protein
LSITAGTTVDIERYFSLYSSADYDSNLILINSSKKYTIAGTASGTGFVYTAAPEVTAEYTPGTYRYDFEVYISEGEGDDEEVTERYIVESGYIDILPDMTAATKYDIRSHAKRTLDAIEAVIEGRATTDQQMYMIQGRQLVRTPIADLLKFRAAYLAEYKAEQNKMMGTNNKVRVRFV